MWNYWKKTFFKRRWTSKKIAFVSILIATSVVFVLIFTSIAPIAAIPSFKLIAGGLPVKITGYIFGPMIGLVTGALSDLISFTLRPTFFHYYYVFAWMVTGMIPGILGVIMNRKSLQKSFKTKHDNANFIITLIILAAIFSSYTAFSILQDDSFFAQFKFLSNKYVFLTISSVSTISMFIALICFRFTFKPERFNKVVPIIAFSAILEICATLLITLGDQATILKGTGSFIANYSVHLVLSPMKIWMNMFIVYFAYSVVSPLINLKTQNGWKKGRWSE